MRVWRRDYQLLDDDENDCHDLIEAIRLTGRLDLSPATIPDRSDDSWQAFRKRHGHPLEFRPETEVSAQRRLQRQQIRWAAERAAAEEAHARLLAARREAAMVAWIRRQEARAGAERDRVERARRFVGEIETAQEQKEEQQAAQEILAARSLWAGIRPGCEAEEFVAIWTDDDFRVRWGEELGPLLHSSHRYLVPHSIAEQAYAGGWAHAAKATLYLPPYR